MANIRIESFYAKDLSSEKILDAYEGLMLHLDENLKHTITGVPAFVETINIVDPDTTGKLIYAQLFEKIKKLIPCTLLFHDTKEKYIQFYSEVTGLVSPEWWGHRFSYDLRYYYTSQKYMLRIEFYNNKLPQDMRYHLSALGTLTYSVKKSDYWGQLSELLYEYR